MDTVELIGVSQNIRKIRVLINQVADTELNILVCGETGVGKELVVQNLYRKSRRVDRPFIKVNCAALPDTLLESEMFGYARGAFTGALRRMRGKFEQADGGVLFLDEIGDMSLPLQAKLLHALEDGDFTPLGSEKTVKTNVWAIAATNHELEAEVENGHFRSDLYHRLNMIKIKIEPLRNRPEDLPYLIDYYSKKYASKFKNNGPRPFSKRTIEKLTAYHWPGNVRELQNILKRIALLGNSEEHIDDMFNNAYIAQPNINTYSIKNTPSLNDFGLSSSGEKHDLSHFSLKDIRKRTRYQVEKEIISYVLQRTNWNRTKASKILDISYRALLYKIQNLNIELTA